MREEWTGFNGGAWEKEVNVRDFIQKNYTHMMVMRVSWQDLHRTQRIYGIRCLISRNWREKEAEL